MKLLIKSPTKGGSYQIDVPLYNRGTELGIDFDNCKNQIFIEDVTIIGAKRMIRQLREYIQQKEPNNKSGVFLLSEDAKKKLEYIQGAGFKNDFPKEKPDLEWVGAVLDFLKEIENE